MTRLTTHALDRFREHHHGADLDDLREALNLAEPLDPELVAVVTQNPRRARPGSAFFLAVGGAGIFVVDTATDTLVTYLRLQPSQTRALRGGTA